MPEIAPFEPSHSDELLKHLRRHWFESGQDDNYFLPFDVKNNPARPRGIDVTACQLPLQEPGWQRWFVLLDQTTVVGHMNLKCAAMAASAHRCELGMGLESSARGQGYGTRFLEMAVDFVRNADTLEWLDLHVIGSNQVARALYRKFGFEECGVLHDQFRIDGRAFDDVLMTLHLPGDV